MHWNETAVEPAPHFQWQAALTTWNTAVKNQQDLWELRQYEVFQLCEAPVHMQTVTHTTHGGTFCADGEGGVPKSLGWELSPQRRHEEAQAEEAYSHHKYPATQEEERIRMERELKQVHIFVGEETNRCFRWIENMRFWICKQWMERVGGRKKRCGQTGEGIEGFNEEVRDEWTEKRREETVTRNTSLVPWLTSLDHVESVWLCWWPLAAALQCEGRFKYDPTYSSSRNSNISTGSSSCAPFDNHSSLYNTRYPSTFNSHAEVGKLNLNITK